MPSFSANGSVLPSTNVEITTEPFGAGPLNTAAVSASGRPVSGSGLSIASFSSGDGAVLGRGLRRFGRLAARRDVALARATR